MKLIKDLKKDKTSFPVNAEALVLPYVKRRQAKGNLVFQGIKGQKRLPGHSMSVKSITMLEIYNPNPGNVGTFFKFE